jgi:hypothetical protein
MLESGQTIFQRVPFASILIQPSCGAHVDISMGGTYAPAAFMQITAVAKAPGSADVRVPTCFLFRNAIIFEGRPCPCTVVNLVSSTLNIRDGENLY